MLEHKGDPGLSSDPTLLHTGGNSGYQAVNLAVLLGAKRILLLGYDMKHGPNGEKHWHEDHSANNPPPAQLADWVKIYATMLPDLEKAGVVVVNCTPESALDCFPKAKLEEVL